MYVRWATGRRFTGFKTGGSVGLRTSSSFLFRVVHDRLDCGGGISYIQSTKLLLAVDTYVIITLFPPLTLSLLSSNYSFVVLFVGPRFESLIRLSPF